MSTFKAAQEQAQSKPTEIEEIIQPTTSDGTLPAQSECYGTAPLAAYDNVSMSLSNGDIDIGTLDSLRGASEPIYTHDFPSADGTYSEWDRETKKKFVESFCILQKVGSNYAFKCKFCDKETKGQYLTALVHIAGVKTRNGLRAAPCALSNNHDAGLAIQNEVRRMFAIEDQRSLAADGAKKRKAESSSSITAPNGLTGTSRMDQMEGGSDTSIASFGTGTTDSGPVYAHLLPPNFREEVIRWLKEDCPVTDIGGFVVGEKAEMANLYCKSSGVVAGIPFASAAFDHMGLKARWLVQEGAFIEVNGSSNKVIIATVYGKCRNILLAERVALNILSRASGVATAARKVAQIKEQQGWHGYVAGTRKTTPGFKNVEKYSLIVGGAATHRLDLSQMVMLKDNHIWSAGSITGAVQRARSAAGFSAKIEVECQSVEEACEAARAGADIVMLDNFVQEAIDAAAAAVKQNFPHILIEASGGISESTLAAYMSPHVDIVSMGALTQGYSCVDFSLKISH